MIKFLAPYSPTLLALSLRKVCIAGAASLMLGLVGCSNSLSGAGPYRGEIETTNSGYTLVEINANTIGPYMRPAPSPSLTRVTSTLPIDVRLMGGDVINVLIADNAAEGTGLFAPLSAGGTQIRTRIDRRGMISLPYVGEEFVAGMTPMQVETMVRKKLKGVTTDIQAHVDLVSDLSGSILVAGAVKAPGRFSTLQGPLTILDAVNQAGGPSLEPYLVNVTIRNGNESTTVNYQDVLNGNNAPLKPNSEVILDKAKQRFVAMGAVGEPGLKDLPDINTTLLEALGSVGGLKETSANPQGVFIFRFDQNQKPVVLKLDMRDPAAIFYAKNVMMRPDDTIYITNSPVYEWQKVISPIVQTLVLGRTVSGF